VLFSAFRNAQSHHQHLAAKVNAIDPPPDSGESRDQTIVSWIAQPVGSPVSGWVRVVVFSCWSGILKMLAQTTVKQSFITELLVAIHTASHLSVTNSDDLSRLRPSDFI